MNNHYLNDTDFTYQLIISIGRNKHTKQLEDMLYLICKNISNKFQYKTTDDKYDTIMDAYAYVYVRYKMFNYKKYEKSIPYFSEIVKRRMAFFFKDYIILRGIKIDTRFKNQYKKKPPTILYLGEETKTWGRM